MAVLGYAKPRAFMHVEVLVVVIVVSILALVVLPEFSAATNTTRDSTLKANLRAMQSQISRFKIEHSDVYPTYATFANGMTLASKADKTTDAIGTALYIHGPSVRTIPTDPDNDKNDLKNAPDGTTGWTYNQTTGDAHDTCQLGVSYA